MLQRIQTLFLLVVFLINGLLAWTSPLFIQDEDSLHFPHDYTIAMILFPLTALLALVAIFGFKNRKKQFVQNRLNILLNLALGGYLAYVFFQFTGEGIQLRAGLSMVYPFIAIIFLSLANKYIMRDEKIVRDADRIR